MSDPVGPTRSRVHSIDSHSHSHSQSASSNVRPPRLHPSPSPSPSSSPSLSPSPSRVETPESSRQRVGGMTPIIHQEDSRTKQMTELDLNKDDRSTDHPPTLTSAAPPSASSTLTPSASSNSLNAHRPSPLLRPTTTALHSAHPSLSIGSRPMSASPSPSPSFGPISTPTATTAAAPLTWVSHSNRELVRLAFTKRLHAHRGILEGRFTGVVDASMTIGSNSKKSVSSSTSSNSINHSSPLHTQLAFSPSIPLHVSVHGSVGVGKTSTLYNLTGRTIPSKHMETSGMQWIDLTWPYKHANGDVTVCEFIFWDAGSTASLQYKYIQTTPDSHASVCLYVVSSLDRSSWTATQKRLEEDAEKTNLAKIVIITKLDDRLKREVLESDVIAFQDRYNKQHYPSSTSNSYTIGSLVVCKLANLANSKESFFTRPGVANILNTIAAIGITTHRQQAMK